jgi:hypothetical protein
MTAKKRNTTRKKPSQKQPGRRGYTAGEWFMVLLGAALVILFAGIIITAILG